MELRQPNGSDADLNTDVRPPQPPQRKRPRSWFDVGAAAIERASAGRVRGLYACPLCMRGFRDPGELTREHVPAQVAGGRKLVLTCRECNSAAGASLESILVQRGRFMNSPQGLSRCQSQPSSWSGRITSPCA